MTSVGKSVQSGAVTQVKLNCVLPGQHSAMPWDHSLTCRTALSVLSAALALYNNYRQNYKQPILRVHSSKNEPLSNTYHRYHLRLGSVEHGTVLSHCIHALTPLSSTSGGSSVRLSVNSKLAVWPKTRPGLARWPSKGNPNPTNPTNPNTKYRCEYDNLNSNTTRFFSGRAGPGFRPDQNWHFYDSTVLTRLRTTCA